jgi:hypothetical protein
MLSSVYIIYIQLYFVILVSCWWLLYTWSLYIKLVYENSLFLRNAGILIFSSHIWFSIYIRVCIMWISIWLYLCLLCCWTVIIAETSMQWLLRSVWHITEHGLVPFDYVSDESHTCRQSLTIQIIKIHFSDMWMLFKHQRRRTQVVSIAQGDWQNVNILQLVLSFCVARCWPYHWWMGELLWDTNTNRLYDLMVS